MWGLWQYICHLLTYVKHSTSRICRFCMTGFRLKNEFMGFRDLSRTLVLCMTIWTVKWDKSVWQWREKDYLTFLLPLYFAYCNMYGIVLVSLSMLLAFVAMFSMESDLELIGRWGCTYLNSSCSRHSLCFFTFTLWYFTLPCFLISVRSHSLLKIWHLWAPDLHLLLLQRPRLAA